MVNKGDDQQQHIHKNHNGKEICIKNCIWVWVIFIKLQSLYHFTAPVVQTTNTQQQQYQNHAKRDHFFYIDKIIQLTKYFRFAVIVVNFIIQHCESQHQQRCTKVVQQTDEVGVVDINKIFKF
jgi:hypothetical protein